MTHSPAIASPRTPRISDYNTDPETQEFINDQIKDLTNLFNKALKELATNENAPIPENIQKK